MKLAVARIGRPHGVKGEVTVETLTDSPGERFFVGAKLQCDAPDHQILELTRVRIHQGRWMLTFAEVSDRSAAERLRNRRLYSEVDIDESDDEDSYHVEQLRGLRVIDRAGVEIGIVEGVSHLPGQDLLQFKSKDGEHLLPMVHEFIEEIDLAGGHIIVTLPEGLME